MDASPPPSPTRRRRTRSDRSHVVYRLTHPPSGGTYVGLTALLAGSAGRSVRKRWLQHLWHARVGGRQGPLADLIRSHGDDPWLVQVVGVVRGKAAAHRMELDLVRAERPSLNTEGTGRKRPPSKATGA